MFPFDVVIMRIKFQWKFYQNTKFFIHENASENIVCGMAAILSVVSVCVCVLHVGHQDSSPSIVWKMVHILIRSYYVKFKQIYDYKAMVSRHYGDQKNGFFTAYVYVCVCVCVCVCVYVYVYVYVFELRPIEKRYIRDSRHIVHVYDVLIVAPYAYQHPYSKDPRMPIRYRSDTFAWDRYLIEISPRAFAIGIGDKTGRWFIINHDVWYDQFRVGGWMLYVSIQQSCLDIHVSLWCATKHTQTHTHTLDLSSVSWWTQ